MSKIFSISSYWATISLLFVFNLAVCNNSIALSQSADSRSMLKSDKPVYTPIPLAASGEVKDVLSDKDIPTGDGGFARDYAIKLQAGEQIAIDLSSDVFDTVVTLLNSEGKTVGKNDDGPDGSSNSLLFMRIKDAGTYVIRVQGFGETSSGQFKLKVTKLKPELP